MTDSKTFEKATSLSVSEHPRLSEFNKLVYPVVSRRAGGLSLGINLNPDKKCSFRCVYCQVDRTTPKIDLVPTIHKIENELRAWLIRLKENHNQYQGHSLKDISIAGDGEPSTIIILPELLELLIKLKKEYQLDQCKLILFTNGTKMHQEAVQKSLPTFFDHNGEIWFKLDFWNINSLKRINRTKYSFKRIIKNLKQIGIQHPLVLQSCVFNWDGEVFDLQKYQPFIDLLNQLINEHVRIKKIQLYTLSRKPASIKASAWNDESMRILGETIRKQIDVKLEVIYSTGKEK